jgi:hypothetical protein
MGEHESAPLFERLKKGLQESIEFSRGELAFSASSRSVPPPAGVTLVRQCGTNNVIRDANWEQVRTEILELATWGMELSIERTDGAVFTIVSDNERRFLASLLRAGESVLSYALTAPGKSEETIETMLGGQLTDCEERYLVDVDSVLKAAKTFVETGRPEPSLQWTPSLTTEDGFESF